LRLLLLGGLLWPGVVRASKADEDKALSTARALFDDHQYKLAQASLTNFLSAYTNSSHAPFATLYLARSMIEQSNYDGAIQQLTRAVPQSGSLAGEYVFWIARARLRKGDYAAAEEEFANLIQNYPTASRRLEAACDQAEACSKMGNWAKAVQLLQKPDGVFRTLAKADPKNSLITRGTLLLGEAFLQGGKYAEGEKVVSGISTAGLDPEWQWQKQYLLCRLELAAGRPAEALRNSTNLLDVVAGPRHQAASRFLRGDILNKLGRTDEALQSYTNNLAADVPPEDQRLALSKAVELILAQNQIQDAVSLLENYAAERTNGAALDLAHLRLGELYLKIYYNPAQIPSTNDTAVAATNYLDEALANLQSVLEQENNPLAAQAHLDRGWCFWAETNMPAAQAEFKTATDRLRLSEEQAVARFKLADTELYQHDYNGAVSNYNRLLQDYANWETVTNGLFDQALYQIIQADLALGDQDGAQTALGKILLWYPNDLFGDRGQLLIGESVRYDYGLARRVFTELLQRSPDSSLAPEVQYAIARTYEQEGNWDEALRNYDRWVNEHATNAPLLLPQVEYSRALVYGKDGKETNALALFTNFVTRFPANDLAPWAQNWVADYYFNLGDNQSAEKNYELLYQTFPDAGDLAYQARLMAGRAAMAGQRAVEAAQYFSDLVNNANAPPALAAQGWFALSEAIWQQFEENPTNGTYLNEAIKAIGNLTNGAPNNALTARAYGRLGDYYMQWADMQWEPKHDPKVYADAIQMYHTVLNFPAPNIDITIRSQAEVGLGRIAERQGQLDDALTHYCNVLYAMDPEHFDPFWVEQAGTAASHIYEQQRQWDKALKVYERVLKAVPSLRPVLEKSIRTAQAEADKARN
jgi:tetratricopeptide (TPR) repeat protein